MKTLKLVCTTCLIAVACLNSIFTRTVITTSPLTDPTFQSNESQQLLPIQLEGKWGYINRSGVVVIKPKFDSADQFSEGLAFVRYPNREKPMNPGDKSPEIIAGAGYIDETGRVVITLESPLYLVGGRFKEGLAQFWTWEAGKGNLHGYIDKSGKVSIKAQFSYALEFEEDLAAVCIERKCGFIDKNSEFVIAPRYMTTRSFSEGLAVVSMDHERIGFINKNDEMIMEPQFGNFGTTTFREGLAAVAFVNGKYGYVNAQGEQVIPMQFELAQPFSEGLAAVSLNGKWGYIDKTGKLVIEPRFRSAGPFSEGLAAVDSLSTSVAKHPEDSVEPSGSGFIDKQGKMVIKLRFDGAYSFANGIAQVNVDGKWGYVDKTGNYIWKPTK